MPRWLGATEAAERLGVKPATLYAYVSRGQVRRRTAPDGRRSEYHADDIADLAVRGRRARPVRPSDIVLPTAVTAITAEGPRYRGVLATELAGAVRFEVVAEHLWDVAPATLDADPVERAPFEWEAPERLVQAAARAASGVRDGEVPAAAVPAIVAAARTADPLREDLRPEAVAAAARGLICLLAADPRHAGEGRSIAEHLVARLTSADPAPIDGHPAPSPTDSHTAAAPDDGHTATTNRTDLARELTRAVDAALVLLADHELAASTLAARVAASSRCDPYAVVLAGVAVLSGPRHGAASRPMERAVWATAAGTDPEDALAAELTSSGTVPGFGHPLYEHGDPRGARLLDMLTSGHLGERSRPLFRLLEVAERRGQAPPNIDAALAGLTVALGAPLGTGELLFTVARIAGWTAHALEQYDEPRLLRPRAVYTGP